MNSGIRWGRTLLFGFLAEIAVIPLFAVIVATGTFEAAQYATVPLSFLGVLVFGFLAARKVATHPVLHGFLVGVAAIGVYYAVGIIGTQIASLSGATIPEQTPPPAYLYPLAHALKLAGGALGGYLAQRQKSASPLVQSLQR